MPQPTIKLNIKKGSIANGVWTAPSGGPPGIVWKQGMELTSGNQTDWNENNWTTGSEWGYYYIDPANGNAQGGQISIPTQTDNYVFTVGPQGGDSIAHLKVKDSAATDHYTVTGPDANAIFTITEEEHDSDEDHFYVWGTASGNDAPIILCDPIIRNRY